jgi:5-(carboxyamino)imidazole ribonucleotide synthase
MPAAIQPPATIGILGGGQLGRMLGLAARALGYGVAVLDPDPRCPAAAVADRVEVAEYEDVTAATRLARDCAVVTYEFENVPAAVARHLEAVLPTRPGAYPLAVTQNRFAERRFVAEAGGSTAPWREVATQLELQQAAEELGLPLRLKAATGGYDGRSQVRVARPGDLGTAFALLGRTAGEPQVAEAELDFECELSVVCARGIDGLFAAFPVTRNRHDAGILVESVAPAPVDDEITARAVTLGRQLATTMDLVGTLAVELFLLRDGSLVVNELAPRVHNSGHWTIEGATLSQFEQHIRAISGLPLGAPEARGIAAMVNLLGTGPRRPACPTGVEAALGHRNASVHLYGKRDVAERRKMGHVTVVGDPGETAEGVLARARLAGTAIGWESSP